jgi:succinate dehydrogenase cytochrome b subunit
MTAVDLAFTAGLGLVLAATVAFAALVIVTARRGGRASLIGLGTGGREHDELGRVAFFAHRVTGFAVLAFLSLHILDIGLYSVSHRLYDDVQRLYGSPEVRVFECGLLFAVLFHAGNGLRLIAFDFAPSRIWSRRLLSMVIATAAVGGTAGSALILAPLFQ